MIDRQLNILKNNSFFLFGARGTGKTSLIKKLFPDETAEYVNLLLDTEYHSLSVNPDSLIDRAARLANGKKWIILDGVQRIPELLNVVHTLIEEKGIQFALTGSSARKLKRGGANLLAGRAFVYDLFPLTHTELGDEFILEEALSFGTLPKLLSLQSTEEKILYLESYVETYLKEEIVAEQLIRKVAPFRRFFDIAAQMNTKILNYSSISRDIGVSVDTIKQYFSILEDTYVGHLLLPYNASIRKRQREAPKFYLFDRGIARAIEKSIGVPLKPQSSVYGEAFEHFIVLEARRLNQYLRKRYSFFYLRTKDDAEIDLVIERPGAPLVLVEIKSSRTVSSEDIRTLIRFKRDIPGCVAYCLCQDPHPKKIEGVEVLPWQTGLKEIFE